MSFSLKVEKGVRDDQEEEEEDIKYGPPSARDFAPNFNELPRVKDEKPYIGPTSSTGNIKILYPRQIDGYNVDHDEMARMDALGLPTGFSFGHMEQVDPRQTRGHKKTYYCNTCMIELNSEDTMVSHMKGVKHMKKQLAMDEKNRNLGQPPKQAIIPIKNPEPTKKKVPIRLWEKIKESSNPVVGLDYIKEFIAVSDAEMEPHYECSICDSQGQANGMFSHLMGQKHRQEFVYRVFGVGPKLSQAELLQKAHEHNENYEGFTDRIVTRNSDEEYPWPAGKEPWSVLRGGTGIVPDAARKNYGKKMVNDSKFSCPAVPAKKEGEVQLRPAPQRVTARTAPSLVLPSVEQLKPPNNLLDSEKMMELGKSMLLMATDYPGCGLKHKERALLESCFSAVAYKKAGGNNTATLRSTGALATSTSSSGPARRTRSPSSAGSSRSSYNERSPPSRRMRMRSPSFGRRDGLEAVNTYRERSVAARRTRSPSSVGGASSSRYRDRSPPSRFTRSPSNAGSCRNGTDSRTGRSPPLGRDRYANVKREPYEEESYGQREGRRDDRGYSRSRMNREMETTDTQARATYEDARYGRGGSRDGSYRDRRDSWSSNESRTSYGDYQDRRGPSQEFEERGSYWSRKGNYRS